MNPVLDIYKASAGSGKTHLLTIKFLSLLLSNPVAYREILAVTFTNKATAEMKERILHELESISKGKKTKMAEQLVELGVAEDAERLSEIAGTVYTQILHDYSRFSVSTIDAFTQKMIRSCSWELGLDAAFYIQLELDTVCNDLAERLFEKIDTPGYETLRKQMADLATDLVDQGKSWNFKGTLKDLAEMLFKESFLEFESRLIKDKVEPEKALKDLREAVFATIKSLEKEWEQLAQAGIEVLNRHGLTADDFSRKGSGFGGRFDDALKNMKSPLGNSYTKNVLEGNADPYTKTTPAPMKARIDAAMPELTSAMMALVDFFSEKMPKYQTAKAISKNLDYLRLILLMAKELAAWRKENNALLISDTHNLLRQLSAETTPEFIYEKTGNRLRNFLMDEFQDTSDFQYHNFKPLLENSMGQGGYNLVVGDVKQAIYRWRNGDWKLLHSKMPQDFKSFKPQQHTLQHNYRSAEPIIRFNNYLFSKLPVLLQFHTISALDKAPDTLKPSLVSEYGTLITDAFADSRQAIPDNCAQEGQVTVHFINMQEEGEREEDDKYAVRVLREVHQTIGNLLQQGYAPGDIAILCRSNNQARDTIEWLMHWQQEENSPIYPLLSADALLISGNKAVQLIIAALQWLMNENNRLAETLLRQSYARRMGYSGNEHDIFLKAQTPGLGMPPDFFAQRSRLRMLPVYDLVNELIVLLKLADTHEDLPYLLAFLDLVQGWARFSDDGVQQFLEFWEEEGVGQSLPAPSGSNAVEVVTIHKAKGLAYRIVLMPFCNWALDPKSGSLLWADMKDTSFGQMPMMPVNYNNDLVGSELAYDYFNEKVNSYMDNLNLLYVALTRARSQMILWAPLPVNAKGEFKYSEFKTINHLLYAAAVQTGEGEDAQVSGDFEEGDQIWMFGIAPEPNYADEQGQSLLPDLVFEAWRTQRGTVLRRIDANAEEPGKLARSRGVLLHEILSKVAEPKKLQKVMLEMERTGKLPAFQMDAYKKHYRVCLNCRLLRVGMAGHLAAFPKGILL
jgi:ATP-dependent helicase/nuclease subunit A